MSIIARALPMNLLYGIIDVALLLKQIENKKPTKEEKEDIIQIKTSIIDESLLAKTLEEYGIDKVEKNGNELNCVWNSIKLRFLKTKEDSPYELFIECNQPSELNALIQDINEEYASNVQEITYNKIKERLAQKELLINQEDVYDDNSIVLTINLE